MKSKDPKVSIIVTSYNRPKLLNEAIRSLKSQTYHNWEAIVVDDNSNLEYHDEIDFVCNIDVGDRVNLYRTSVRDGERLNCVRYAACINLGLDFASGDYISYLADDDFYLPNRLEKMVTFLESNRSYYVVYGKQRVELWDPSNIRWKKLGTRKVIGVTRDAGLRVDHNSIMHRRECLSAIPRPYWTETGSWTEADARFFAKLSDKFDFYPIDEVLDVKRLHPEQIHCRMRERGLSPVYEGGI